MFWYFPLLLEDSNNLAGFAYNAAIDFTGGDWILVGIVVLIGLGLLLAMSGVRSGGVVAIGAAFIFLLSLFYPGFIFLFWIAFIIAIFVLVNAIRKKMQGQ